ncbi:MAG TPA: hypothetical protein VMN56_13240 [Casimicrobiaceae bacterium]|nr:hypothetical protein [Casimicrobiaceae bacterium]
MPHAMIDAFPAEETSAERLAPLPSLLHAGTPQQQAGGACSAATAQQCACEPAGGTSPPASR